MPEVYRYPLTAYTEKTDYLQIDIVEYKSVKNNRTDGRKSIASQASSRNIGNSGKNKLTTIFLPIPGNISDNVSVRFGSSELNNIAGAAIGGIQDIMSSGKQYTKGMGEGLQSTKDAIAGFAEGTFDAAGGIDGIQGFFTRKLASSAANILGANITPGQLLARNTGEVLNPNMELLFEGPTLRTFKFSFKLTPRNPDEAKQIKQIIRSFKAHASVKLGSGSGNIEGGDKTNTFIRTPDVFELRYKQGSTDHQFLHKFKQCFLEGIDVNYTAAGSYSTYEDGTPVSMIMDLTFKEIEPIYDKDQLAAIQEGKVGY
jgi:hypothetical protein|tara:strand:- start:927 stop:1868 length:942 start_codon:yes stop_codon:yes gene_type:complete